LLCHESGRKLCLSRPYRPSKAGNDRQGVDVTMAKDPNRGRTYYRDGRAPIPASEATSKSMSSNRGKNTRVEVDFRKALWAKGLKGYRLHAKDLPGRPDIVYRRQKVAIFIHGCFWHRCPKCKLSLPKSNPEFWREKFASNLERDKKNLILLNQTGWTVLTVWECEIKSNMNTALTEVVTRLAA
jgi:DNA mismatch endonuclease, patch repair protein